MSENAENTAQQQVENDNTCVVCFKPTIIFSIGTCNHPVCFECSARMRCLCLQNECPICRQDLPKVIFTKTIDLFATLDRNNRNGLFEKKFRIVFTDLDIQKIFYHLLENRCSKCDDKPPFVDFHKLKEHVRKVHELFYCEICTENLKIFSTERRCYTRSQLALHRRNGDPDDKSHRGHPRCDYCELRYLDKDELFRHLRREHYFCHLCDADGINLFYGTIREMRDHFKAEHYLCEEDDCIDEEFTAVFRTEIDLRAHKATIHSHGMSRTEARQARILEIDISYGPRGRGGTGGGGDNTRGGRIRTNDTQREFDLNINPELQIIQQPQVQIDTKNEQHFPSLISANVASQPVQLANSVRHVVYGQSGLARTKENFPALGENSNRNQISSSSKQISTASRQNTSRPSSSSSTGPTASSLFKGSAKISVNQQRPPASSSTTISGKNPSFKKDSISDFPSLPQNSSKKARDDLLMEDLILPTKSNIDKNIISSKHRALANDYVSMASQMTKVNLIKQKDESNSENLQKSVPKLNSINNFPTLATAKSSSNQSESSKTPQWLTVKSNGNATNQKQPKVDSFNKKQNQVPQNGMKKVDDNRKSKKDIADKNLKAKEASKENQEVFSSNLSIKAPPPGFKKIETITQKYTPLPNASKRNQALVGDFQDLLKSNEAMQEFRLLSQMFRDGNYFARSYFESCKGVLGEKFYTVFPELLVLLPDIDKQQKLYRIYLEDLSENRDIADESASKKKNKKAQKLTLDVCTTCQQVLLSKDLTQHVQSHSMENNFPTLSNKSAVKN